jgi:hypothetical protein
MMYLLSRNKVSNFEKWHQGFTSHAEDHRSAGLKLVHLWHDVEDRNNVFLVFEVSDIKQARAFIDAPEAAKAGKEFGVLEGEYHFVESDSVN